MSHSPEVFAENKGQQRQQQQAATNLNMYSRTSDHNYNPPADRSAPLHESHEPLHGGNNRATPSASAAPAGVQTNEQATQPQQQQQRAAPYVVSDRAAAAIGQSLIRALSGEDLLEEFLRKYPSPVPGSGVGVGPIKSTTQAPNASGRLQRSEYQAKRRERFREKRQQLRALQEREYQAAITPARRANSATVGLHTFGMTFVLLGLHYTGYFALDTVLPAMAICVGGGLQLIAGLLSWTQGQTYAYLSFVANGAFFLSLTCVWMLPNASFSAGAEVQAVSDYFMGAYLSVWGVVSFFLFLCTPAMNVCLIMKSLATTLFFLCAAGGLMNKNDAAVHAGGYFAIIAGGVSLYLSFAGLLNEVWDKHMLPVLQTARVLDWIAHGRHGKDAEGDVEEGEDKGASDNVDGRTGSMATEGTQTSAPRKPGTSSSSPQQLQQLQQQQQHTRTAEASVPPAAAGSRDPLYQGVDEDVIVEAPSLVPSDSD